MKIMFEMLRTMREHLRVVYNRMKLRAYGVRFGNNFRAYGPIDIQIHGKPEHIVIGDNVVFLGHVVLYNRENGRIMIGNNVRVDHETYFCAARNGAISIGNNTKLCYYLTINAGADVAIGDDCIIAGYVNINASEHMLKKGELIRNQDYAHQPIRIGNDVWLGTHVSVNKGVTIGDAAVIGSNAVVTRDIPENAIAVGIPAKVIKYRECS